MNDNFADLFTRMHMRARYCGLPCPHCGEIITEEDIPFLVGSNGGQYLNEGHCAAHFWCFHDNEATTEWKEKQDYKRVIRNLVAQRNKNEEQNNV